MIYFFLFLVAMLGWSLYRSRRKATPAAAEKPIYAHPQGYVEREPQPEAIPLPAIVISRGTLTFSRIGGLPNLPEGCDWPVDDEGKPLAFLCQIAFPELPALARELGYPETGALFFFYCQDQSVWGFDPKDFPKWRVIYTADLPVTAAPRAPSAGLAADDLFPPMPLGFSTAMTRAYDLDEDDDSEDGDGLRHMMGGYPDVIQNPMEEECQLASSGVYLGDPKAYQSTEALALRQEPNDWTLLLQLDSDEEVGMMWGDAGRVYFWIRRADLAKRDFSRVWMILQCY